MWIYIQYYFYCCKYSLASPLQMLVRLKLPSVEFFLSLANLWLSATDPFLCEKQGVHSFLSAVCEKQGVHSFPSAVCEKQGLHFVPSSVCEKQGVHSFPSAVCEKQGVHSVPSAVCEKQGVHYFPSAVCEKQGVHYFLSAVQLASNFSSRAECSLNKYTRL